MGRDGAELLKEVLTWMRERLFIGQRVWLGFYNFGAVSRELVFLEVGSTTAPSRRTFYPSSISGFSIFSSDPHLKSHEMIFLYLFEMLVGGSKDTLRKQVSVLYLLKELDYQRQFVLH